MRKCPVSISLLFPLLVLGACQPGADPAAALVAAQMIDPPGGGDLRLDGPISPPPRNLRVTSNIGGVVLQLDFDCGGNAELHEIFKQNDGTGAWYKIDDGCVEDGPARGHIFDNHTQPVHTYCYKVKASNLDHNATSDPLCAVSDRWRMPPMLPQLSLGVIQRDYITILIADKSVTEQGFHLLRRIKGSGAPFTSVAEFDARLGNNITIVHRDETIVLGNTYEYKVNIYDRFGNNADTPIIEATAFPKVPDPPSLILFDARTPSSLAMHWNNCCDVVDKYHLTFSGPSGTQTIDVSGSTLDRTLSSLTAASQYCVTITAENASGVSRASQEECAYTLAPPPSVWPKNVFNLKVDPPVVTRLTDGDDFTTPTYRFSFRVCNNLGSPHPTAPYYHIFTDLDGLELTLDHASHQLAPGACETFLATDGVPVGLHNVKVEVQPTSGDDGYGHDNVNNRVFTVQ